MRRLVGGLGRALIAAGTLVLLFVVYQLWGTSLQTASAQRALDDEYERVAARYDRLRDDAASTTPSQGEPLPAPPIPAIPPPTEGDLVGQISIPRIGLEGWNVVQGVSVRQLKRGAGHYPATALPGQSGNAAVAGHRTTYGAPFHDLDDLVTGDEIVVETLAQGRFRYEVTGTTVVSPSDVSVLEDKGDDRLTLTACEPRYSARRRIVVTGILIGDPVPPLPGQRDATAEAAPEGDDRRAAGPVAAVDDLDGEAAARAPTFGWGVAAAAIWVTAWVLARFVLGDRPRLVRWLPYAIGAPLFGFVLYSFFEDVARLLPASY